MEIEYIDMDYILPNENQPRQTFNEETLEELKASIERNGIIQPIILKKMDSGYRIVAGERRWRAAMDLNFRKIPSIVLDLDSKKEMEISIIENLQRENLNPIDEALAFKRFLDDMSVTQESLAEVLGKSRSYISNSMRLLALPEEVIEYIVSEKISSGHGRAILSVKDTKNQIELAEKIYSENLSVRDTEKEALKYKIDNSENSHSKQSVEKSNKRSQKKDIFTKDVEDRLTRALGNRVTINKAKNRGKIEIEFSDEDQLEFLIDILENHLKIIRD